MEPTQELVDDLYRERITRARAISWEDKFLASGELFELAVAFMEAGIRYDHPDADDQQVDGMIQRRLDIQRRLENSR